MKKHKLKSVKDQVIVITGASSGIGLETAKLACSLGASVVLASRNETELKKIVLKLSKSGGKAHAVKCDVAVLEDVENLRDEALLKFGRVDTWINNAGHSIFGSLLDVPLDEERAIFETNFWGVRHGSRVAIPELKKTRGALINLGSEVSGISVPIQGIYSATKHAVKAYTDALRLELKHLNIPVSVTLVRPSAINTPFAEHALNRLRKGAPSLPAPVYDVAIVAKAILKAAETPQRDVYIGSTSKIYDIMGTLFPQLTDSMMGKVIEEQMEGDPSKHPKAQESVNQVPVKEGKTRARQKNKVKKKSLYTSVVNGQKQRPAHQTH